MMLVVIGVSDGAAQVVLVGLRDDAARVGDGVHPTARVVGNAGDEKRELNRVLPFSRGPHPNEIGDCDDRDRNRRCE